MISTLFIASIAFGPASITAPAQTQKPLDRFTQRFTDGDRAITVSLHAAPFQVQSHFAAFGADAYVTPEKDEQFCVVDGRRAWGTEYDYPPETELTSVKVWIDGKETHFPRPYWEDCFEPRFTVMGPSGIKASRDKEKAGWRVVMGGSDAASAYEVEWWFGDDGQLGRTFYQEEKARPDFTPPLGARLFEVHKRG